MDDFNRDIATVDAGLNALVAGWNLAKTNIAAAQPVTASMLALGQKIDDLAQKVGDQTSMAKILAAVEAIQTDVENDDATIEAIPSRLDELKQLLLTSTVPVPTGGGGGTAPPPASLPLLQMSDDTDPGDPVVLGDPALRPDVIELYVANPPTFTVNQQFEVLINDKPITGALTTTSHGGVNVGNAQYFSLRTALPAGTPLKISVATDGPTPYTSFWVDGVRVNGEVYYFTGDPDGHGVKVEQQGCFLTGGRVGNFYAKGQYPNAAGGSTAPGALLPGQMLTPVYDKAEDIITVTFNHADGSSETKTDKFSVLMATIQRDGDIIDLTQLAGVKRATGNAKNNVTIKGPGRDSSGKMILSLSCDGILPSGPKKAVLNVPATTTVAPIFDGFCVRDAAIDTPSGENAAGVRASSCNPILKDFEIANCQDGTLGRACVMRGQVDIHDNGRYIDPQQQSQKHGIYNNVPSDTFTVEPGAVLNLWNNGGGHNLKTRCEENNCLGTVNITCGAIDDCADMPYGGNGKFTKGRWQRNNIVTKWVGYGNEVKRAVDAATGAVTYSQNNPGRTVSLAGIELVDGAGSINVGANVVMDAVFIIDASCTSHGSAPTFKPAPAIAVQGGFTVVP